MQPCIQFRTAQLCLFLVLHSAQFVAAREEFFHVAHRADFLVGQAVSPVTAGWSRRFGCGYAARWGRRFAWCAQYDLYSGVKVLHGP